MKNNNLIDSKRKQFEVYKQNRFLNRGFIIALSLIALLVISGTFYIQLFLFRQTNYDHVINIAGKQRMYSQKLSKSAMLIYDYEKLKIKDNYRKEFKQAYTEWKKAHHKLTYPDKISDYNFNNSDSIKALYKKLDPFYHQIEKAGKRIINISEKNTIKQYELRKHILVLLDNEAMFLTIMDNIVNQYEQESKYGVKRVKIASILLAGLTLLLLIIEMIVFFKPAIRKLNNKTQALINSNKVIQKKQLRIKEQVAEIKQNKEELVSHNERLNELNQELLQAKSVLENREHLFRILISNLPDIDFYLFNKNQQIVIAGGTEMKKLGLYPENFEGKILSEVTVLDEKTINYLTKLYNLALSGQYAKSELKYGQQIYMHKAIPVRNKSGEVIQGIFFSHNVTKVRENEKKIQEQNIQIQEKNQELQNYNEELRNVVEDLSGANQRLEELTEKLILSESQHKTLINNLPKSAVFLFDKKLNFLLAGGKELIKNNIDPISLTNQSFHDYVSSEAKAKLMKFYKSPFEGKELREEMKLKNKWYLLISSPVYNQKQNIIAGLLLAQNINSEKQANLKTEKALKKEKELNKLKNMFVTTASHQFRTPLTTIQSSIELLKLYTGDFSGTLKEKMDRHFKRILSETSRLNNLMDDVLMKSKIDAGKISCVLTKHDYVQFCKELIEQNYAYRHDKRKLHLKITGQQKLVSFDRKLITHVLNNLISNAFKYSQDDPEVRIHFEKNEVITHIIDSGIGIPDDDQNKLFTSFFRARNAQDFKGTGLGLDIAKRFVEMHKGEIKVESTVNQGSTFSFILPVKQSN